MIRVCVCALLLVFTGIALAAEQSPSEKVISEAISLMESKRDGIADPLERARIDKAVRELESLIEESDPKPVGGFTVDLELLKKKFATKPIYDPKSGELTLKYDFPGKAQLADFETRDKQITVARKALVIEATDEVKHIAKFKSFTVTAVMTFKTMDRAAIGSSNGFSLMVAGDNRDAAILLPPAGTAPFKLVPPKLRSGSIPVMFKATPEKVTVRYAGEVMSMPTNRTDDVHQLVLQGGHDGCAFSNLEIVGVPDPNWLKEFAKTE